MALTFGIELTILLFAAMIGIVLAQRFGQSAILGEILIGVLIGPSVLQWVSYNNEVRLLAELGAILLLFTVGLECDYRKIYNTKNSIIALFGVIVPFVAGWLLARAFGYTTIEGLFIGTALTATSIAITAHVLRERGLLSTPIAETIIGAAVVDDVLGLIMLAIITGIAGGTLTASAIAIKAGYAVAFIVFCILLIKPVNALLRNIPRWMRTKNQTITLFAALAIAFLYAGIANAIGLSSIVGAFMAGVTLESFRDKNVRASTLTLETIFGAIFFVALGVAADFRPLVTDFSLIGFTLALVAIAILSKFIGCIIPAKLAGHTWRESLIIGLGMVPRGEVAMIVGLLGLGAGILSAGIYSALIAMAFLTTIATPVLLGRMLERK